MVESVKSYDARNETWREVGNLSKGEATSPLGRHMAAVVSSSSLRKQAHLAMTGSGY